MVDAFANAFVVVVAAAATDRLSTLMIVDAFVVVVAAAATDRCLPPLMRIGGACMHARALFVRELDSHSISRVAPPGAADRQRIALQADQGAASRLCTKMKLAS